MTVTERDATPERGSLRRRAQANGASSPALTGRGGIVVLVVASLLGALLSRWLDVGFLAGAAFAAGCVLAVLATRQADLPMLVVSPPLAFFGVTLAAELVSSLGEDSLPRALAVGLVTALASGAPWLFLGTLLAVGIAVPRGLPTAVRDLRTRLAGSRAFEEEDNADPVRWDESPARSES